VDDNKRSSTRAKAENDVARTAVRARD
jgi:hypothetical protein